MIVALPCLPSQLHWPNINRHFPCVRESSQTSRRVFELARDQQEELEELDDDEDDDSEEQPKFRQPRDDDDTSEDDMDQEGDEEEEYAEIVRSISLYL